MDPIISTFPKILYTTDVMDALKVSTEGVNHPLATATSIAIKFLRGCCMTFIGDLVVSLAFLFFSVVGMRRTNEISNDLNE